MEDHRVKRDQSPNMRLFVALPLSDVWRIAVGELLGRLRSRDEGSEVRWVKPEGVHLTLRFLGEVDDARLDALGEALDKAVSGHEAPHLAPGALGAFPNLSRPRVVWVGLEESGQRLAPLQVAVEKAVRRLGWPREKRAFRPHLTLGRVRDPRRGISEQLVQALGRESIAALPASEHRHVVLMQSHLSRHGARYEALRTWQLLA